MNGGWMDGWVTRKKKKRKKEVCVKEVFECARACNVKTSKK